MDKLQWIKQLVLAEQQMEESGIIDLSGDFDAQKHLHEESIDFLKDLKTTFIELSSAFNQLKGSPMGKIKIYGISNTTADFMLFRNSYKLIFSLASPGEVVIRFNHIGSSYIPGQKAHETSLNTDTVTAEWGAYAQLIWKYNEHPVNLDYLVRYYMTRFVKESAR